MELHDNQRRPENLDLADLVVRVGIDDQGRLDEVEPGKRPAAETKIARVAPVREIHAAKAEPARPAAAHTGVMIQIGAAEDATRANELLVRAKSRDAALAHATPFTEKVQKGSGTLWRARFAGLSESQADSACKTLKRTGFSCFTTRN